jgi:hypothetical protein
LLMKPEDWTELCWVPGERTSTCSSSSFDKHDVANFSASVLAFVLEIAGL